MGNIKGNFFYAHQWTNHPTSVADFQNKMLYFPSKSSCVTHLSYTDKLYHRRPSRNTHEHTVTEAAVLAETRGFLSWLRLVFSSCVQWRSPFGSQHVVSITSGSAGPPSHANRKQLCTRCSLCELQRPPLAERVKADIFTAGKRRASII